MNFEIANRLIFECGASSTVGAIIKDMGCRQILLICGKSLFRMDKGDKILENLTENGIQYDIFNRVPADPTDISVDELTDQLKSASPDLILAVGGGSVMDFSKSVAACLTNDCHILKLSEKKNPVLGLPLIAIPTTAGTGSEVTSFSIITDTTDIRKIVVTGPHMRARLAICDPELLISLPPDLTAYTGMDALTHAMEAYVSRLATPFSDTFAIRAIELIGKYLPIAYEHPENLEARSNVLMGSVMAGYAFDNAVLGLVHAIAHPLGAHFHIQHGAANAMALAEVIRFNSSVVPEKTLKIGIALGIPEKENSIDAVPDKIQSLACALRIPRLSDFSISESDLDMLAENSLKESCLPLNPRDCTKEDIVAILRKIM